jgi:hypothetical protein
MLGVKDVAAAVAADMAKREKREREVPNGEVSRCSRR